MKLTDGMCGLFCRRQQAELAAFAKVQEEVKAKRARLETVQHIHSRQEMRAVEAKTYAEEQRQVSQFSARFLLAFILRGFRCVGFCGFLAFSDVVFVLHIGRAEGGR